MTTNRKAFRLYIHRIYPNNVRQFLNHSMGRNISSVAKEIYNGRVETKSDRDQPSTTHVNMARLFDANRFGMYRIFGFMRRCFKGANGCSPSICKSVASESRRTIIRRSNEYSSLSQAKWPRLFRPRRTTREEDGTILVVSPV